MKRLHPSPGQSVAAISCVSGIYFLLTLILEFPQRDMKHLSLISTLKHCVDMSMDILYAAGL